MSYGSLEVSLKFSCKHSVLWRVNKTWCSQGFPVHFFGVKFFPVECIAHLWSEDFPGICLHQLILQTLLLIISVQPTPPIIEIQSSRLEVGTTEDTTVGCSVAAARPAVAMKWYLGDEDITAMSEKEETLTDDQVWCWEMHIFLPLSKFLEMPVLS